jgi:phage gp46-like protein
MTARSRTLAAVAFGVLAYILCPAALADGDCTVRPPTTSEKKLHGDALALFQRVAPKAPDGWKATDTGDTLTTLCLGSRLRRGFSRSFDLERGRAERDQEAQQAYAAMMEQQRAQAAASQAAADDIDAKINALTLKVQAAVTAQKFDQIEPLNRQIDALMKQKMALTGVDGLEAQTDRIEADATRDTRASFALYFESPTNEPQDGAPYRTVAGRARVNAFESKGNPTHLVFIEFGGLPEQAVVRVEGDPARVRALVDATDLKSIAAFR